jgi:hypothetical protein
VETADISLSYSEEEEEEEACLQALENFTLYFLSVECYDVIMSRRIVGPSTKLFCFATSLCTSSVG